jgi:isopenicillin-N N-acyltransferase-like protein
VLNEISDKNFAPVNSTWHAPITDAVYWGMDWICPTFNTVLGDQIRKYTKERANAIVVTNFFQGITAASLQQSPDNTFLL